MTIAGILVQARIHRAADVVLALSRIPGVEVHAATPDGRLVVTIERPDDQSMGETFDAVSSVPGVLDAGFVFGSDEDSLEADDRGRYDEAFQSITEPTKP